MSRTVQLPQQKELKKKEKKGGKKKREKAKFQPSWLVLVVQAIAENSIILE
jgi:hypothetical protein